MYYSRAFSEIITKTAKQFPCVVLTGARQVGKTTLLKSLFPHHRFLSLDLPSLAEQADENPELFLQQNPGPLLIDEVQYAPKLFRRLKLEIDCSRHEMGRFILTGSQKFTLMKEVSDSLAGRAALLQLEGLSVKEINFSPQGNWSELLARGMFPELWRNPELDAQTYYSSYVATYLERDVRQLLNVQSLRDFERFLRACAARSGGLLNMSELARDVGIKGETARQWLSVLEASNQVSLLEPYFENVGKRIVKSPKLYLNDPGLLCFLLGFDAQSIPRSPLIGQVWETLVYAEFRKLPRFSQLGSLWFYRDAQGREVDFLFAGQGEFHLFEVKWLEHPEPRWINALKEAGTILSKSKVNHVGSLNLVCRAAIQTQSQGVTIKNPTQL